MARDLAPIPLAWATKRVQELWRDDYSHNLLRSGQVLHCTPLAVFVLYKNYWLRTRVRRRLVAAEL